MKLIVVTHEKGGVAKTAVALNMAAMAAQGLRTLLIEVDQMGTISDRLEIIKELGEEVPQPRFAFTKESRLEELEDLHSFLQDDFDVVIADTPGNFENADRVKTLVEQADMVLIPTTPQNDSLQPLGRFVTYCRSLGRDPNIVFTRVDARIRNVMIEAYTRIIDMPDLNVFGSVIREYKGAYDNSWNAGQIPATWDSYRVKSARQDIEALWAEIHATLYAGEDAPEGEE